MGEFFAKAQQSSYWDNTIFLVIADHDARVESSMPVPVKHFHIPALILGKDITPKVDERIASSLDMPVTLLSLAGVDVTSPMLGNDLSKPLAGQFLRAMMQFGNNFGYLDEQGLVVLQPEQAPHMFAYQGVNQPLRPIPSVTEQVALAQAHALLGNYLYGQQLYRDLVEPAITKESIQQWQ
ncbi:sulfatase-like hydrolase/transferase [Pseudoalteromonas sp. R3]|uniref:sulfatase-like hydrolase/transferase n=1 Tax=Pseudoalteromonas sp. R3 TaxID=1709477 RepID=UPI001F410536|nr:sulfatase-like hydrolase/transferase [Pseudoalteromonas sp. R3]